MPLSKRTRATLLLLLGIIILGVSALLLAGVVSLIGILIGIVFILLGFRLRRIARQINSTVQT